MGFADRDYNREDGYSGDGFMAGHPTCKRIIFATCIVFLLQILVTRKTTMEDFNSYVDSLPEAVAVDGEATPEEIAEAESNREDMIREMQRYQPEVSVVQDWMEMDTRKVLQGQVWRLLTAALLHSRTSVTHILFNMLLLYWFGRSLESQYGSREFMLFYMVAAIIASLGYMAIQLMTGERVPSIGASGAVMAVICVFTIWNPGYTIQVYFLFPIQMRYLLAIYVLYDLHPILLQLSGTQMHTGVAHAAHLGGLAFGYLYCRNSWRFEPAFNRLQTLTGARSKPKNQRSRPRQGNTLDSRRPTYAATAPRVLPKVSKSAKAKEKFDARVDEILAKISIQGEESLTDAERQVLQDASSRYRKRK